VTSIVDAAVRAHARVPFYRALYPQAPRALEEVPFISHVTFHRARGLLDCIADREEITGALPAYYRNVRRFPWNIVESEEEARLRQLRFTCALTDLELTPAELERVVLVTDDPHGPFACELSKAFAWERHQASLIYFDGDHDHLAEDLRAFEPTTTLVVSAAVEPETLPGELAGRVVQIWHLERAGDPPPQRDLMLACDELHLFAVRPSGGQSIAFDAAQLALERDPRTGLLAVTTLGADCFPLIRYLVGVALPALGEA